MSGPSGSRRGPRSLSEILGTLMEARGYGRQKGRRELEAAWVAAAGNDLTGSTRVTGLRRGVLRISVAHSALLEELAGYRKPELLQKVRQAAPELGVRDLRFQVGTIDD